METQNYSTKFVVKQAPSVVLNAIKNFRAWWSEQIEGATDQLNEEFIYNYKDVHLCKIKLIELVPDKKLVYQVVDNQFSFTKDKSEWIDTKLIFELSGGDGKTEVKFTHEGLVPGYECYNICFDSWGVYIKKSLYDLIITGKGQPNPRDSDDFDSEVVRKWKLK